MTKEEALTEYLIENQAGFYRLAYSVLKNPDESLDAGLKKLRIAMEGAEIL